MSREPNWDALYLSAEPESEEDAWRWLGMILSESPYGYTDYANEKRWARAHALFAWLQNRHRFPDASNQDTKP